MVVREGVLDRGDFRESEMVRTFYVASNIIDTALARYKMMIFRDFRCTRETTCY